MEYSLAVVCQDDILLSENKNDYKSKVFCFFISELLKKNLYLQ